MAAAFLPARLRDALTRVTPLRSVWHLGLTIADHAQARPACAAAECEDTYRKGRDPWHYASAEQQARFRRALALIDGAFGGRTDLQALEIGCGEGAFTALLADRCRRLVAADASPTALERARARVGARPNLEFRRLDVLQDGLGSGYDLILLDHLIDMFGRRSIYRDIASRIAAALAPEGRALIGAMRAFEFAERSWWSPLVLRGGVAILDWIGRRTALEPLTTVTESFYSYTLFRRRA